MKSVPTAMAFHVSGGPFEGQKTRKEEIEAAIMLLMLS